MNLGGKDTEQLQDSDSLKGAERDAVAVTLNVTWACRAAGNFRWTCKALFKQRYEINKAN